MAVRRPGRQELSLSLASLAGLRPVRTACTAHTVCRVAQHARAVAFLSASLHAIRDIAPVIRSSGALGVLGQQH